MSVTIDYFFNSDKKPEDLKTEINTHLGCNLHIVEDERDYFYTRFMNLDFSFGTHTLVNDGKVDFENYRYQLGVKTWASDGYISEIRSGLMAMVVFILYHRLGIKKGMLVYDVQQLMALYEERIVENNFSYLFDTVSQEFIGFPEHIVDLYKIDS